MKGFTTMEKLQCNVSASFGAVLKYGDKVFVTDVNWRGGYIAEIWEFIETPEETGLADCECRLNLFTKSEVSFEDNGHAIAWCIQQSTK